MLYSLAFAVFIVILAKNIVSFLKEAPNHKGWWV